ncbi:MAG: reactive intermediate/imine deaminase [Acidobacteria bacterium]|nr:MAG: reactive intermediate/imine deaminase [Acidobacteriota bacterium]
MGKKLISNVGPTAGPYSPAVVAGGLCFVSGQIGFDAEDGQLAEGGVEGEFRQALRNLESILQAAGLDMSDVVSTTIFVTDLAQFGAVNLVFGEVFGESAPARATVEVSALPLGASVEIAVVAAGGPA